MSIQQLEPLWGTWHTTNVIFTLFFGLLSTDEVLDLIKNKPAHTELILTGRCAPDEIIAAADLVTEMHEIKHYYTKGVEARRGIEN